jgi:palmitoyltransferase
VTHSSSIMPLLYLLHQPVGVDSRDAQGHTALMWAAYQGDALSVDLLLRHGASPTVQDDAGLTPLHWAVVRGNWVAIRIGYAGWLKRAPCWGALFSCDLVC